MTPSTNEIVWFVLMIPLSVVGSVTIWHNVPSDIAMFLIFVICVAMALWFIRLAKFPEPPLRYRDKEKVDD
jgi:hypothetical protein